MNKHNIIRTAAIVGILLMTTAAVFAQDGWLVEKTPPAAIGPEVATGTKNDPGPDWLAPVGGLLQTVFWDVDPKCDESGAVVIVASTAYTVPPAPYNNGNCNDPVQALYSSRVFDVAGGDVAYADMGEDSGHYWFYFVTSTPTPTDAGPPATLTPTPTATNTATSTPTATATPEPTATMTTLTATPTATDTPAPPDTPVPAPTDETTALDPITQPKPEPKPQQPTIRMRYYLPWGAK